MTLKLGIAMLNDLRCGGGHFVDIVESVDHHCL